MSDLLTEGTATISACERYRYTLTRRWDDGPAIAYVLLNPSTATADQDDPTVSRCMTRAERMDYGAMHIVNLFALRATEPQELYLADDPVGPENDHAILWAVRQSEIVVCGWGNHGRYRGRGSDVLELLRGNGIEPHCLATTGQGQPWHPLYLAYSLTPIPLGRDD